MIKRYSDKRITDTWCLAAKFLLWQTMELAVILGREMLGIIPVGTHDRVKAALTKNPIRPEVVEQYEAKTNHDLIAFLEERSEFLTPELRAEFHRKMTSYDTEEAPFAMMLKHSCDIVLSDSGYLLDEIRGQAIRHRYTPMNARTHGQEAEMQSFGKRCLTWYVDLLTAREALRKTMANLAFSKLSGAIGTNSGIEPELETQALKILGFKPWVGATQIMPRVLYAPIAGALANLAQTVDKIAEDIRLGARSGRPLWHEPFGKGQKGSSAMPHKKNTILTENIAGMARMAESYSIGIQKNIKTWEERDIAQSSVERVFWPDLFHVTLRAIKNLTKVMSGLVVYPDHMLTEIIESRGCYASNEAKELLVELGLPFGLSRDDAYLLVQLACFQAFAPTPTETSLRNNPPTSLKSADACLLSLMETGGGIFINLPHIGIIIAGAQLRICGELDCSAEKVDAFNAALSQIFGPGQTETLERWNVIFNPSHILTNEAHLFKETFGV